MRVLYIFSGSRGDKFKGLIGKDYPDTQFYGLNHLKEFGLDAEYYDLDDIPILKFAKFLPFSIRHIIATLFFTLTERFELIFGASLLYFLFLKKLFRLKQKFVLLDINIARTISANRNNRIKFWIVKSALFEATAIVSLSEYQKEVLQREFPNLAHKLFVAHLGVDTTFYKAKYDGRKDYFLAAGRDNGRDYRTLFEIAKLMPDTKFEIVASPRNLSGLGPPPPNLKVNFDLPFNQYYLKLQEAKALLLLTHSDSYKDGADCSGQTVLLEAFASGVPVIATKKAYIKEYAEEGENIILVEPYDENGLKSRIMALDSKELYQMSKSARNRVEKDFSTKIMASKLAKVFNQVSNNG